jgi:hypothetical protein
MEVVLVRPLPLELFGVVLGSGELFVTRLDTPFIVTESFNCRRVEGWICVDKDLRGFDAISGKLRDCQSVQECLLRPSIQMDMWFCASRN